MTDREKLIEAMARGMCEHVYPNCDFAPEGSAWVSTWAREREAFEEQATAALFAIEAMGAVVVPVEATERMERAGGLALHRCSGAFGSAGACYAAMIEASPYAKGPT
jgi:hypothetical protein